MTQEEKELLIKDLCSRLPYGVIVKYWSQEGDGDVKLGCGNIGYVLQVGNGWWKECKPYLRPMKSMTKGEKEEYRKLCKKVVRKLYVADGKSWPSNKTSYRYFGTKTEYYDTYQSIDYLISRHFDYRGLIGKKLALKATKGIYEF